MYRYQYSNKEKAAMYIRADLKGKGLFYSDIAKIIGSKPTAVTKAFETLHLTTSMISKLAKKLGYSANYMLSFEGPMYIDGTTPELDVSFPSKITRPSYFKIADLSKIKGGLVLERGLTKLFKYFFQGINAEYYLCSLSASFKNGIYKIYINKHYYTPKQTNEKETITEHNNLYEAALKDAEGYVIDARRQCIVPVLVEDKRYTAEQRLVLAQLAKDLTDIEQKINRILKED